MIKARSNTNTPVPPTDVSDHESVNSFLFFLFVSKLINFFFEVRLNLPVVDHQVF